MEEILDQTKNKPLGQQSETLTDTELNEKKSLKSKGPQRSRQHERWNNLQSHLDQALNQWNEITKQMQDELSPDQKRLQEVKQLLTQLKVKLEEF